MLVHSQYSRRGFPPERVPLQLNGTPHQHLRVHSARRLDRRAGCFERCELLAGDSIKADLNTVLPLHHLYTPPTQPASPGSWRQSSPRSYHGLQSNFERSDLSPAKQIAQYVVEKEEEEKRKRRGRCPGQFRWATMQRRTKTASLPRYACTHRQTLRDAHHPRLPGIRVGAGVGGGEREVA